MLGIAAAETARVSRKRRPACASQQPPGSHTHAHHMPTTSSKNDVLLHVCAQLRLVLTHYGGWHSGATGEDGFLTHVCHTGDGETHTGWGRAAARTARGGCNSVAPNPNKCFLAAMAVSSLQHPRAFVAEFPQRREKDDSVPQRRGEEGSAWVRGKCEEAMREVLGVWGEACRQARLRHRRWQQRRDQRRGGERRATRRATDAMRHKTARAYIMYAYGYAYNTY
jgi:hypothetical protein